ncbi:MAG: hypothetical protein ACRD0G_01560 [Acidimicrobiales bacterium]
MREARSPLTVSELAIARPPQPRGQGAWLDVYDDSGRLGRFEETTSDDLAGAAIVRLVDLDGDCPLAITHPSRRARVDGPSGVAGFISQVGRVRVNWELHGASGAGRRPDGRAAGRAPAAP